MRECVNVCVCDSERQCERECGRSNLVREESNQTQEPPTHARTHTRTHARAHKHTHAHTHTHKNLVLEVCEPDPGAKHDGRKQAEHRY